MENFKRGFGYWMGKGTAIVLTVVIIDDVISGRAEQRMRKFKRRIRRFMEG